MKPKLRLLPLVIFAASLTLSLKIGTLWQDVRLSMSAPAVAQSKETGPAAPDAPKAKAKAKTKGDTAETEKQARRQTGSDSGDAKSKSASEATPDPASAQFDASTATDTEIELLQKLASRREKLDRREKQLDLRESMISATERRIDAKIAELGEIKSTIEKLLKKHDSQQENKLKSLVKIYENMKPKDAARIFDKLDLGILLDVVERMRESKTAPIMANMSPARAKSVTAALVARRTLPKPRP
jgi:flagellar motility protein MotE (MotC chaperone)